jgi:hypothetical protein
MRQALAPRPPPRQHPPFVRARPPFIAIPVDLARAKGPFRRMTRRNPRFGMRVTSMLLALLAFAVAGVAGHAARTPTPVAMVVGGPAPESDAGPSLPDACSRRVGCLLR